jgi:hypothetical protein
MKINTYKTPFTYFEIENFISDEHNDFIYNKCLEQISNNIPVQIEGEHHSTGIELSDSNQKLFVDIIEPIIHSDNIKKLTEDTMGSWMYGLQYHFNEILQPHNDNPYELIEDAKLGNHPIHEQYGFYKGLVYIGDRNLDYSDYGTRIYKSLSIKSEVREVKFKPGNCIIFKCDETSFHGTDFKNGLPHNRITIGLEYLKKL